MSKEQTENEKMYEKYGLTDQWKEVDKFESNFVGQEVNNNEAEITKIRVRKGPRCSDCDQPIVLSDCFIKYKGYKDEEESTDIHSQCFNCGHDDHGYFDYDTLELDLKRYRLEDFVKESTKKRMAWIDHELKHFEGHIAKAHNEDEIEFRNPQSSFYAIYFLLKKGLLIIWGDLGYAMYQFGQKTTLREISKMDIQYFHSKCVCANTGDCLTYYDQDYAKEYFAQYLVDRMEYQPAYGRIELKNIDFTNQESFMADLETEINRVNREFQRPISKALSNLSKSKTDLEYDYSDFYEIGKLLHIRCNLHLEGLKQAIHQLETQNEVKQQ